MNGKECPQKGCLLSADEPHAHYSDKEGFIGSRHLTPAAPPPCPNCERLGRELYTATNDAQDYMQRAKAAEAERDQAQARIAELEREVAGLNDYSTKLGDKLSLCQNERDAARASVEELSKYNRHLADRVESMEAQCQRLREALGWYADITNYGEYEIPGKRGPLRTSNVGYDTGERASQALAAQDPGDAKLINTEIRCDKTSQAPDLHERVDSGQNSAGGQGNGGEIMPSDKAPTPAPSFPRGKPLPDPGPFEPTPSQAPGDVPDAPANRDKPVPDVTDAAKAYPNGYTDSAKSEKAPNYTPAGITPAQLEALGRVALAAQKVRSHMDDAGPALWSARDALDDALAALRATGWGNG